MSLQDWHKFGWLKPHETSLQELGNLLAIADRDIADSESDALFPYGLTRLDAIDTGWGTDA